MKVINKKLVSMLCILVVIISIGIFLICQKDTNKVTLDEVRLKEPKKESGMFAIMLQSSEGSEDYVQSPNETFPKEGYTFNSKKSGCLDSDGKKIEDVTLSYTEGKVTVETGNTSYCYIYFDKELTPGDIVQQNASATDLKTSKIGDLKYRFVGENPNNYICFGNGTQCSTSDNYMYRIIGITENGELKIQKYSALPDTMKWNNSHTTDVYWNTSNSSSLFTSLNGEGFLNSETYIPQDNKWKDLILSKTWTIGDVDESESEYTNAKEVYNKESTTESNSYKIGLIYLSDYYLAYNDGAGTWNCDSNVCRSWMFHSEFEWMMTRRGESMGMYGYFAWLIETSGASGYSSFGSACAVRPVFYLSSKAKIKKATGSTSEPYIVELNNN